MKVLQFNDIRRAYARGKDVTNGVSFSVESGEVVGLLLIGSLYLEANVPGGLIGLWVVCLLLAAHVSTGTDALSALPHTI